MAVLGTLVKGAETEAKKASLLVYQALHTMDDPVDTASLDAHIGYTLLVKRRVRVEFSSQAALIRLEAMGLVARDGHRWQARPLPTVISILQAQMAAEFA